MKPDWKYAPEWAKFMAKNSSGEWFWFECKPIYARLDGVLEWGVQYGQCAAYRHTRRPDQEALDSLEERP